MPSDRETEMQRQARALADPTRHEIFRHIAAAEAPVGVAELAEAVGVHHTAVRQHLTLLRAAGLVTDGPPSRRGPGRPSLRYRVHPEAAGAWGTEGPYRRLSALLAEAVRSRKPARAVGRDAGRREAARLVAGRGDGPLTAGAAQGLFEDELAREGFRPRTEPGDATAHDVVLERCPFEDVAAANPAVTCALHQGLAEGLAEGLGGLRVTALRPADPHTAGCTLTLRVDRGARSRPAPA